MWYVLVTYGKSSGVVLAVSGRMALWQARKRARNTRYLVDIVQRY